MNVSLVLLGYMGCGKSTLGRLLADALSWEFVDLDDYVADQEGYKVSDIFAKQGEIYFRKIESKYLEGLLHRWHTILSLGGGTPCHGKNMEMICRSKGTSIYLKASSETLFQRLKKERPIRPIIAHLSEENLLEFIQKHLLKRMPYYRQADHTIAVDTIASPQIVTQLLAFVSKL